MSSGSAPSANSMEEINMTAEEVHRFTRALRNHTFREMLHDYAQEISDPDNRKRYEEEIKLLEQERGNTVEFIHPKPFRVIKTSVDGNKKCFINICSNERVGKPEFKSGVSQEGHRGQCWSLPHSLHPGRQDTDGKGNKIVIYDVVFHPDTLHIAGKNKRFMDMVDNTAIQGIQKAFKVTVDHNNVKEMRTKYKGTPQPCVIRKPIPGFKGREPTEQPDPLAFPYPEQTSSKQQKNTEDLPSTTHKSDADPQNIPIQPVNSKQPTKPNYTLKYRSFIDLQDFRCSPDSARSPIPKEIVITIDLPLLKSASDANLEVTDRVLLLESQRPSYRLELALAYPVDQDKGDAKFNQQKRQLTVTLPVLPLHPPAVGDSRFQSGGEGESEETCNRDEEEEKSEEEGPGAEETNGKQLEETKDVKREDGVQDREERLQDGEEVREVILKNQNKPEVDVVCDGAETDSVETGSQCDASVCSPGGETSAIITNRPNEEQLISPSVQYSCGEHQGENPTGTCKFLDVPKTPEETQETEQENLQASLTSNMEENHRVPQAGPTSSQVPATHQVSEPTGGRDHEPPAVSLREVDEDGNETVISDHSTSAGFVFHNSLMFELD